MKTFRGGDSSLAALMINSYDTTPEIKRTLQKLLAWEIDKLSVASPHFQKFYTETLNTEQPSAESQG